MNARRLLEPVRQHGFTADRDVPAYRVCPNAGNLTRVAEEVAEGEGTRVDDPVRAAVWLRLFGFSEPTFVCTGRWE